MNRSYLYFLLTWFVALVVFTDNANAKGRYDGEGMRRSEISGSLYAPAYGSMFYEGGSGWIDHGGFSAGVSLNYGFWFSRHVGITSGLRVSYLCYGIHGRQFSTRQHGTVEVTDGVANSAVNATMEVTTPGVDESQTMTMFEVPLLVTLQTRHLFCNLGVGLSTALTNYSQFNYSKSEYNLVEVAGFGVVPATPITSDIDQNTKGSYVPSDYKHPYFVSLAAEVGFKFYFDDRNVVSLSLFGRYAINDCQLAGTGEPYVMTNSSSAGVAPMHTALVERYRSAEGGLRIAYHFGIGRKL